MRRDLDGVPLPGQHEAAGVDPPIAENTWLRAFQSWYFGNDAGQVAHAGWVS